MLKIGQNKNERRFVSFLNKGWKRQETDTPHPGDLH
jgi:hypothetical protein